MDFSCLYQYVNERFSRRSLPAKAVWMFFFPTLLAELGWTMLSYAPNGASASEGGEYRSRTDDLLNANQAL
jgi:hypothetical protein